MTEPTPPDGHQPAEPPRFGEAPASEEYTGEDAVADATPPRAQRPQGSGLDAASRSTFDRSPDASPPPPADPTAAFAASPPPAQPPASSPPPPGGPSGPVGPTQQPGGAPPPGPYGPSNAPAPTQSFQPAAAVGAGAGAPPPSGPGTGNPPPQFGGAPEPKKKSGLLVGGLIALVVALVGGLGFVLLQGGDDPAADDPPDTRDDEEEEEEEDDPEVTDPPVTDPPVTDPPVTDPPVTDPPVTDPPVAGSVENVFVRVEAFDALVADADLTSTLQNLAARSGDNPVATTDDVANLCAALPLDGLVSASVEWVRDGDTVLSGDPLDLLAPGDGACLNNSGEPLVAGSYEVSFTDAAGAMSGVALFTVGSETVTQTFVNDTGVEVCSVDSGPTPAGFYQSFELTSGEPLAPGDSILFDIANVEHEARAVDCSDTPLDSFFFTPGEEVNLSNGELTTPPSTTEPPPAAITNVELSQLNGEIGSLDIAVTTDADIAEVLDVLLTADDRLRLATTDTALSLCVGWDVPGALEADIVWEFNRVEVARIPMVAENGRIGTCVPPGGAEFDEGAYQVYLQRDEIFSTVETYTVGREETLLAFVNDTGVAICEVGFSPTLTNFYTFYPFGDSSDFEESLEPGESFTIVAPFIESDIRGRDCDGNNVSEAFGIPPTDQVINLTTGQP